MMRGRNKSLRETPRASADPQPSVPPNQRPRRRRSPQNDERADAQGRATETGKEETKTRPRPLGRIRRVSSRGGVGGVRTPPWTGRPSSEAVHGDEQRGPWPVGPLVDIDPPEEVAQSLRVLEQRRCLPEALARTAGDKEVEERRQQRERVTRKERVVVSR